MINAESIESRGPFGGKTNHNIGWCCVQLHKNMQRVFQFSGSRRCAVCNTSYQTQYQFTFSSAVFEAYKIHNPAPVLFTIHAPQPCTTFHPTFWVCRRSFVLHSQLKQSSAPTTSINIMFFILHISPADRNIPADHAEEAHITKVSCYYREWHILNQ